MFDIGAIWVPRIKDTASGLYAQRWNYYVTVTATNVNLATPTTDPLATCPVDRARIVSGISVALDPGATEISTFIQVQVTAPPGVQILQLWPMPRDTLAGGQRIAYTTMVDAIMFPGEAILCTAGIGTATNPKTLQFFAWGYDIPRGNIQ